MTAESCDLCGAAPHEPEHVSSRWDVCPACLRPNALTPPLDPGHALRRLMIKNGTAPCPSCSGKVTVSQPSETSMDVVHSWPSCPEFDRFLAELLEQCNGGG